MIRPLVAATLAGMLAGPALAQPVTVSSKIDTEGGVLGQIILQVLNHAGIETRDRIQLGTTPIMREAIIAGEVDIYPEYTGNAAFFFNRAEEDVWRDPQAAWQAARDLDKAENDIIWLTPAPANNTWGVALREDLAQAEGLATFSQFGEWVAAGGAVKLVASAEFVNSPPALPAFQAAYGFTLAPDQLIVLSGGDTAATIAAAAAGTSGANAAMVYGTDGAIAASHLVVLEDDRHVQPVYQPTPIIRGAVLAEYPQIGDLLDPAFGKLDLATLQRLNGQVQVEGLPADQVARDWLTDAGLLN